MYSEDERTGYSPLKLSEDSNCYAPYGNPRSDGAGTSGLAPFSRRHKFSTSKGGSFDVDELINCTHSFFVQSLANRKERHLPLL